MAQGSLKGSQGRVVNVLGTGLHRGPSGDDAGHRVLVVLAGACGVTAGLELVLVLDGELVAAAATVDLPTPPIAPPHWRRSRTRRAKPRECPPY